ncbi:T9SS type A sorting domain-containing protein [Empedobacter falsenii]|uniref:T9SS type A sorting domain-containing protein n=1 Tax=Empedobacter falsenii TaxID=343874 RepID=A0ABY8VD87_9FLAO|nr:MULTISPECIES: T9SS type A sorting domain-containing protein [Empedobacter]WIH97480.1 T9SS type A sorting domain-containing protein [Empedobacter falsenii]
MIKLFYLLTFATSSLLFGQIELQKTIEEEVSAYSVNGETYYVTTGWYSNQITPIKIFDKNFNLYKKFDIENHNNYGIIINNPHATVNSYILSKGIFDLDDKLDIIVLFEGEYNGSYNYGIKIFNEDGEIVKIFNNEYKFHDGDPKYIQVYHDEAEGVNKLLIKSLADEYRGIKAFTDIYTLPSKSLSVNDNNIVTNSLKIYPNPVNSILTIDNPNNGNSEAKVFDMTGKLIKNVSFNTNDKNISLNVSDLIKGNYIIKIGNSVTKIIKN